MQIADCVKGFENGLELVGLLESLSEKTCTYKLNPKPGMKMAKIDNCNNALKFLNDVGVVMELKASPENLVDGGERCLFPSRQFTEICLTCHVVVRGEAGAGPDLERDAHLPQVRRR